ncbi:tellurite resistance TerB family protein [Aeromonas sanarellii]|uniref:tellurite resistance TerB family protein n=1 Tax=Aeromonas sanarellii TaxID=633415 RepID=UPI00398692FA
MCIFINLNFNDREVLNMGFWTKVIGGAVIGVGAIAAAPFTGGGSLLGAASLASSLAGAGALAAGAGAAGATAGAVMGRREKEEEERKTRQAKQRGEQEADARNAIKLEKLRDEIANILRTIEVRENFLVTAFAVGICAANADHNICDEEREEIETLVAGLGKLEFISEASRARVEAWYNNPPNLNTVWKLIEKNGLDQPKYIAIFSNIVEMVIWADDERNNHEHEFTKAWNSLVA